jgi:hypothetical protein
MDFEQFVANADPELQPILNSCFAKEYREVFDRLQEMGWPEVLNIGNVVDTTDVTNKRKVNKWMDAFGYAIYACPKTKDGRWAINGERVRLYRKMAPPLSSE